MTSKKVILLSVLTVLVGVGVVYALSYEFKPENSTQTLLTAEGVKFGLKLTMTLEKAEYSLGEPINITFTISNISNQTINYPLSAWDFDFWVYNDTNSDIYRWSSWRIFPGIITNIPLDTGESLTRVLTWPQTSNRTMDSEGVPVSPGTYYIVGQTGHMIGINGKIETTPIRVTITR